MPLFAETPTIVPVETINQYLGAHNNQITEDTYILMPEGKTEIWVERFDADSQFLEQEIKAYKNGQWIFWPIATVALVLAGLL